MHTLGWIVAAVVGLIASVAVLVWCLDAAGLGPEDREAEAARTFDRERDLRCLK
ncbi:hypothetical protein K0B96_06550 [Horticoccus luteus]|uniref:Uncharacterized protein n=1 Tax=Horticoccus luteus TaxID=2862869 RepID=A0A8F9TYM8_9BACT|nr:hypothetical protein [Horticoccus luteus]QYM80269.1 hypothetical protein K0B96_06550 [Horticoccus luteus]